MWSKDITIAKYYKASVWTWGALGTMLLTVIFYMIAYSAVGWGTITSEGLQIETIVRKLGLWQTCETYKPANIMTCRYYSSDQLSDAMRAAQTFATLALIGMFCGMLLSMAYVFFITSYREFHIGVLLVGSRISTALFLLIAVSIYGGRWADDFKADMYSRRLDYCFGFACTCLFLEVIGGALMFIEVFLVKPLPEENGPRLEAPHLAPEDPSNALSKH